MGKRTPTTPSQFAGEAFEKVGGALMALGGLELSVFSAVDGEHAVGMNFWFVFGIVMLLLGILAFVYGVSSEYVRKRREKSEVPPPAVVRRRGIVNSDGGESLGRRNRYGPNLDDAIENVGPGSRSTEEDSQFD